MYLSRDASSDGHGYCTRDACHRSKSNKTRAHNARVAARTASRQKSKSSMCALPPPPQVPSWFSADSPAVEKMAQKEEEAEEQQEVLGADIPTEDYASPKGQDILVAELSRQKAERKALKKEKEEKEEKAFKKEEKALKKALKEEEALQKDKSMKDKKDKREKEDKKYQTPMCKKHKKSDNKPQKVGV